MALLHALLPRVISHEILFSKKKKQVSLILQLLTLLNNHSSYKGVIKKENAHNFDIIGTDVFRKFLNQYKIILHLILKLFPKAFVSPA